MSQQPSWGSSSQRRGLPPISTAFNSSQSTNTNQRGDASSGSPSRNAFSPSVSAQSALPPHSRHHESRTSSISSTSSPFSPSHGVQQQPTSSQLLSSRSRTIPPSSNSQLASSAASAASQGGVGPGSGGGGLRLARASPSLSQSSDIGSPQNTATPTSAPFSDPNRVSSLVNAQVSLLLTKLNQEKDLTRRETSEKQIVELVGQYGMDVFVKYFRRLVSTNASQIIGGPSSGAEAGTYNLLVSEVQKIRQDPEQARKIAESLDTSEGEVFREFDVSTFMERCKLDSVSKSMLALSLRNASKADLRAKADAILSNNLQQLLMTILNPATNTSDDLPPSYLASLLDSLLQTPPRNWNEESQSNLNFAIRARYEKMDQPVPSEVLSVLQLSELMGPANNLVKLVQRTGTRATSSLEACKEMLASAETRDINYGQVASVLLFMVITQNGQAYNPSIFVAALREHRAGKRLDWQDVVHAFDRVDLNISKPQFLALYTALLPLAQEYENFDLQLLWGGQWQQLDTQLSFVTAFLSCSSDELDASAIPRLRKAYISEDFEDGTEDVKKQAASAVKHPLVSLDATAALFNMIFQTQETYKHAINLGIPETIINPHTDYFVVAAAAVPQPWGSLQEQAFRQLFIPFLQNKLPGADFVFQGLWKRYSSWLATRLIDAYTTDPRNLICIFDHAMEHDWLTPLTGINNEFGVDLAALAHSRGALDLDAWLDQAYQAIPQIFPQALARFIEDKAREDLLTQKDPSQPITQVMLSLKTVYGFLTFLQQHLAEESLTSILRLCIQAYPRLINYGEGYDPVIDANSKDGNAMSHDADIAMQEHFKKLYNKESEVRDLVSALRTYKHSEEQADQELFACMIAGLFDEYNCFAEYPDDALATTAVLFGNIINYNLLSRIALQAGLSMVLEALQDSSSREDKMYKFGVQALKETRSRLVEWPSFCERLIALPGLQGTEIWPIAENVVSQRRGADTNGEPTNGVTNGTADEIANDDLSTPFASLLSDPPLRPEIYETPEEDVQDRVLFALNNVSERNLDEKFADLNDAIRDEYHQWLAHFLVQDRAKYQPNYHGLYLQILERFDSKWLWEEVTRETIVLAVRMLNADSTMNITSERPHLKNVATWLGAITLARDKPIMHRNISFIDFLIEANKTSRLLVAIPFTCKTIVAARDSKTFMPPNPWTSDVLAVLLEFYHHIDMKINLKFEIEVLFTDLGIPLDLLEPSNVIRSSTIMPFDDGFMPNIPELEGFADLSLATLNRQSALRAGLGDRFSPSAIAQSLPDISTRLYYPPTSSNNLVTTEQTRQVFLQAAQHAINEIIFPVVERSVTIAAISASQLVTKDFATEPNEERYRTAAHSTVKALAGSLALVTCREPLRMSMSNNVRALARGLPGESLAEGVILMFVNDNIDTVCKVVEEAAEKQSIAIIEEHISQGIHARQMHNPEDPFSMPLPHKYAFLMPEPFRPSTTAEGLHPEQLAIYEGFGPSRAITNHGTSASQDSRQQLPDVIQAFDTAVPNFSTPADVPAVPKHITQSRPVGFPSGTPQLNGFSDSASIEDLIVDLYRLAKDATEDHIKELGPSAPVRDAYTHLVHYMDNLPTPARDRITEIAATEVMKVVFMQAESFLEVEIFVQLLSDLSQISATTAEKIFHWLAGFEDDRFLNPRITIALLNHNLVDLGRIDLIIAKTLRDHNSIAIQFLADLMNAILLGDYPIALRADFARSIEALSQWVAQDPGLEIGKELLGRLGASSHLDATLTTPPASKNDEIEHTFSEWIQLVRGDLDRNVYVGFILQLNDSPFFKDQESTVAFIRTCLEHSIAVFEQQEFGTIEDAYLPIDALAQLLVLLVVYQGNPEGPVKPTKPAYLDSLLSLVGLVQCAHFQQRNENANPRIFFRLYSGILCEVQGNVAGFADCHDEIMLVFGRLLLAVQPTYFPAFSSSWLALISHRIFMSSMLKMSAQEDGWDMFLRLVEILLTHTGTLVESRDVPIEARRFYSAVLKVMLVLHHDFQEFLTENHVRLCNSLSPNCSQLRNLVVSAFPSSMPELPDPFTQGFKVDRLEDIRRDPVIRTDFVASLNDFGIRHALDALLQTTYQQGQYLSQVCQAVSTSRDSIAMTHALVLYIASRAIATAGTKGPTFNKATPHALLFHALMRNLPHSARYSLIGAIVNQLRYPNSHTHYFSYLLLDIFGFPSNDSLAVQIQEQIARTLLERLIVFRPHPWGLLITILELYKNPNYEFFKLPFVMANEEVFNLPALQPVRSGGYV